MSLEEYCRLLRENDPQLQELQLDEYQIGADGAKALAYALKSNNLLQYLNLHLNQIGDDGAKALADGLKSNTSLQELHLGYNQIGDEGAKALADGLNSNTTLQILYLYNNQIGDVGAKALADALKINASLQELHLGCNQIGSEGAKALAEALKSSSAFQVLYLTENQIGSDGAKALADALQSNRTLQVLDLSNNQIRDDGAQALLQMLEKHNGTLRYLYLNWCPISQSFVSKINALATANKNNTRDPPPQPLPTTRVLRQGQQRPEQDAAAMRRHEEEASAKGGSEVTSPTLPDKSDVVIPKEFAWMDVEEYRRALHDQQQLDKGKHTQFADSPAASRVTSESEDDTAVRRKKVDIASEAEQTSELDESCRRLRENDPALQKLYLRDSQIDDDGAKALADGLNSSSTLQVLYLFKNHIGADGAKALAEALKRNTTLEELYLGRNQIGNDGATALADALLKSNAMLKMLHLGFNRIRDDGAKALAEALRSDTTLIMLYLYDNQIGNDGAKALAAALKSNTTLQQLKLYNNQIGDDGAEALADALRINTTLKELSLGGNQIGDDGAQAMLQMLEKHNGTLSVLSLGNDVITLNLKKKIEALVKANKNHTRNPPPQPLPSGVSRLEEQGREQEAVRRRKDTQHPPGQIGLEQAQQYQEQKATFPKDGVEVTPPLFAEERSTDLPVTSRATLGSVEKAGMQLHGGGEEVAAAIQGTSEDFQRRQSIADVTLLQGKKQRERPISEQLDALPKSTSNVYDVYKSIDSEMYIVVMVERNHLLVVDDVKQSDTLLEVKKVIFDLIGIPTDLQELCVHGEVLNEHVVVKKCGVKEGGARISTAPNASELDNVLTLRDLSANVERDTLITVTINSLFGDTNSIDLQLSPALSINYVKGQIQLKKGVPIKQQHICRGDEELDDWRSLSSYGLSKDTTLELVLKLQGGASTIVPADAGGEFEFRGNFIQQNSEVIDWKVTSRKPSLGAKELGRRVRETILSVCIPRSIAFLNDLAQKTEKKIDLLGIKHCGKDEDHKVMFDVDSNALLALNLCCSSTKLNRHWFNKLNKYELCADGRCYFMQGRPGDTIAADCLQGLSSKPPGEAMEQLEKRLNTEVYGNTSATSNRSLYDRQSQDSPLDCPSMWAISFKQLLDLEEEASIIFKDKYPGTTMRDVNERMIKPVCQKKGTSYALYLNPNGLMSHTFISHSWDEPFGSFVESIRTAFPTKVEKPNLWICSFALIQGNEQAIAHQLDVPLPQSPFVQALQKTSTFLVVRNSCTDLYSRIWCVCELIYAMKFGLYPDKTYVTGPNCFSHLHSTVMDAKATNVNDKEKILRVLLNEHDRQGIDSIVQQFRGFEDHTARHKPLQEEKK